MNTILVIVALMVVIVAVQAGDKGKGKGKGWKKCDKEMADKMCDKEMADKMCNEDMSAKLQKFVDMVKDADCKEEMKKAIEAGKPKVAQNCADNKDDWEKICAGMRTIMKSGMDSMSDKCKGKKGKKEGEN